MDVSHIHTTIDTEAFADWLGLTTQSSREALKEKLSIWRYDPKELNSLSYQYASVKEALSKNPSITKHLTALFEELDKSEPKIQEALTPSTDIEKEAASELIFLNNILSPLNFVPFLLTLWSYIRVYIFPGMSLIMPIAMLILPYIIIRFVFHLPIPTDRYLSMIVSLLAGDTNALLRPDSSPTFGELVSSFITNIKQSPIQAVVKFGGVATTVVQSIVQPYLTYKHLSSINNLLYVKSGALLSLQNIYKSTDEALKQIGMEMPKSPLPNVDTERQHLAYALLDSTPYRIALRYLGNIRALFSLASHKDINPVYWRDISDGPLLKLQDTFDIRVSEKDRIPISIQLHSKRHHALLTGPNRGGKSTALRAVALSTLLAHTYGCSVGRASEMTPYKYLYASLKRDDIPGSKSHFEREVEFTAQTLNTDGPTLVLVDELFHTTNPADAHASCKIYCDDLWKRENIASIISTHLFELVEQTKAESVLHICCPATYKDNKGSVEYKYGITEGICKVSSVYEILKKYGFETAINALKSS